MDTSLVQHKISVNMCRYNNAYFVATCMCTTHVSWLSVQHQAHNNILHSLYTSLSWTWSSQFFN